MESTQRGRYYQLRFFEGKLQDELRLFWGKYENNEDNGLIILVRRKCDKNEKTDYVLSSNFLITVLETIEVETTGEDGNPTTVTQTVWAPCGYWEDYIVLE